MGKFTYENQGEFVFLVYSPDTDEKMDKIALGMTSQNKIQHILSPVVQIKDSITVYKYNVSQLTVLSDYKKRVINRKQFLSLISGVIDGIEGLKYYLIPDTDVIIDQDYLFVDRDGGLHMIVELNADKSVKPDVKSFINDLINTSIIDDKEDCTYVQKLKNYINRNEHIVYSELSEVIKDLEKPAQNERRVEVDVSSQNMVTAEFRQAEKPVFEEKPVAGDGVNGGAPSGNAGVKKVPLSGVPSKPANDPQKPQQDVSFAIPGSGQEEKKSSLFSGLFGKRGDKNKEKTADKADERETFVAGFAIPGVDPHKDEKKPDRKPTKSEPKQEAPVVANASAGNGSFSGDYGSTVILDQLNDVTVVMSSSPGVSAQDNSDSGIRVELARVKTGEKKIVDKECYIIGRSASTVDFYITDNPKIGREHAFLYIEDDKVFIKDNNSKNHTYVNNEMVPAGEKVRLVNDDKIRLADEEMIIVIW